MKLIKILPLILLLLVAPARSFAAMPDITAGEMYFDVFKGYYVLNNNVRVVMNNHGVTATITADGAKVNVLTQKCWAEGSVTFTHDTAIFSCDNAFLQWKTKTAEVVGSVKFASPNNLAVTSSTAIFNWKTKIVDFYGGVNVTAEQNLNFESGVQLENKIYEHVRYSVAENKILALDENFSSPQIKIPSPDSEEN